MTPAPDALTNDDHAGAAAQLSVEELCEKFPDKPVPLRWFDQLYRFVVDINEKNKERNGKIVALQLELAATSARVAALEARNKDLAEKYEALTVRPTVTDKGVWRAGVEYGIGDLVSHSGCGWICNAAHVAAGTEPDHVAFRLFVKKGRDGKDLRDLR